MQTGLTRFGVAVAGAFVMLGASAAGLLAGAAGAVDAAGNSVTISQQTGLLCGVLSSCGITLNPGTVSPQTGEAVVWTNTTTNTCTLNFGGGRTLGVAAGSSSQTSFSQAGTVGYTASCNGQTATGSVVVTQNPFVTPTPGPATPAPAPANGPTTTSVAPGTAAGAGTAKPRVVAAATPKPGTPVIIPPGPQGSSALPPVTATPSPTPDPALDPSTLPTISAPSASPKPRATVAAASNTSSRTKAFYIAGGVVAGAVALGAAAFYGIRRWRQNTGGTPPADDAAYLI